MSLECASLLVFDKDFETFESSLKNDNSTAYLCVDDEKK